MSLVFNDTVTQKGIIQTYEKEAGYNAGDVSGNTTLLKSVTADINLALDDFVEMAIKSSGTWQFDDSNYSDYPIISTDLISGQRDYSFTADEDGNLVLEIFKVLVADPSGVYNEITPIDVQSQSDTSGFYDGRNQTGIPTEYDKTANAIFLNSIPNYNMRLVEEGKSGLKAYVNREAMYFTYTDTSRKPGVPGIFHKYFALRPAMDKARRGTLSTYPGLSIEVAKMEANIKEYFSRRTQDERARLAPALQNNR